MCGGPRSIRLVLLMTMVVSTVGFNFHVLVPVLASKTLHVGAEVFGALGASFGLGALAGALLAATFARASWKAMSSAPRASARRCWRSPPSLGLADRDPALPHRCLLHDLDREQPVDHPADRARPPAWPRALDLPLRLRRLRADRRPARRLALGRRRHGAGVPRRRHHVHGDDGVHVRRVAAARRTRSRRPTAPSSGWRPELLDRPGVAGAEQGGEVARPRLLRRGVDLSREQLVVDGPLDVAEDADREPRRPCPS